MFAAAGSVTCSLLSGCRLPSGLGLRSRTAWGWLGAGSCSPGSVPTWLGMLSCAAAATATSESLACSVCSHGNKSRSRALGLQLQGLVGSWDVCVCLSQWGDWVLGSDLPSQGCCAGKPCEVLPSFRQPCRLPSSPGALQAQGLWGAMGAECRVNWASAGEWLQQETESAGKARLREQERVGVPRHWREAVPWAGGQHGGCPALPEPPEVPSSACST